MIPAQDDLFRNESDAIGLDESFATAKRIPLDATSWIEVVPGWMSGSRLLFASLSAAVPWQQHDRVLFDRTFREPRLTAAYPSMNNLPDSALLEAARVLSNQCGVTYDGLWLNLYRNGQDSTAWHRDWPSCRRPECIVPVLTLGATRRFLIKPRRGGSSVAFRPRSGDLILMGGRAQADWVHCVPKEPGIEEARISVNFQSSEQGTPPRPRVGPF